MNSWVKAARLRTLPLALSCTIMGSALALMSGCFDWSIFLAAFLTTILLQVLSNFANDYGDYKNGADLIEGREDRMLSSGQITEQSMRKALVLTSILSFISGSFLLYLSFDVSQIVQLVVMLVLGLGAIWAALKYTAGDNPYGYRGLGDVFVFLFFGLVGVLGTYYLYSSELSMGNVQFALIIGFLSVAVLNLNNMRDIVSDEKAGKVTVPVRLGFNKAKNYHTFLLVSSWFLMLFYVIEGFDPYKLILFVPMIVQFKHLFFVLKCEESKLLDSELKKVALTTFLIAVIVFAVEYFG